MRTVTEQGIVDALAACIAIPSVTPPGDAAGVAAWIEEWAREFGGVVTREEVWPGADNLLVELDFGSGPTIVLNSHMDVVDPATQEWATPPFVATTVGDRIHGRGAADAKGSLVGMVAALERLAAAPEGLRGRVVLTAVVAEEAGGLGSLHLVRDGLAADYAIVGEPTGLEIAHSHKGTYMRELIFHGTAAHSASPWLGRSAVADAAAFVAAAERATAQLAEQPHPALGPATMTVTRLSGGELQNTVPDAARLVVDRRLLPGETHAAADLELDALLAALAVERPGIEVEEPRVVVATVPSETDPSHPLVAAGLRAVAAAQGGDPAPVGFNAGCDMSKLVGAGIPTIICGPGALAQAHGPDEFVPTREVVQAVAIYEAIVRDVLANEGIPIR